MTAEAPASMCAEIARPGYYPIDCKVEASAKERIQAWNLQYQSAGATLHETTAYFSTN
jgi:hypothetical protein